MPTAPISTTRSRRLRPTTSSSNGLIGKVSPSARPRSEAGYCGDQYLAPRRRGRRAPDSSVTPALRRATVLLLYMLPNPARSTGVNDIGTYMSAGSPFITDPRGGKTTRSGITPMTTYDCRSSAIVRPRMPRILLEGPPPQRVAEHRHSCIGGVVFRGEQTPKQRARAEDVEELGRDPRHDHALRLCQTRELIAHVAICGHAIEQARGAANDAKSGGENPNRSTGAP